MASLSGNKGEWGEIYIFLKLMGDRKIHAADKDMNRLDNVFLNIIKIIREESKGKIYHYYTGDNVKIHLNAIFTGDEVPESLFFEKRDRLFELMSTCKGNFSDDDIEDFLSSVYITKLKEPPHKSVDFRGTQDILMTVMDYRSGAVYDAGFSCKSDFAGRATLFNASADNTNF